MEPPIPVGSAGITPVPGHRPWGPAASSSRQGEHGTRPCSSLAVRPWRSRRTRRRPSQCQEVKLHRDPSLLSNAPPGDAGLPNRTDLVSEHMTRTCLYLRMNFPFTSRLNCIPSPDRHSRRNVCCSGMPLKATRKKHLTHLFSNSGHAALENPSIWERNHNQQTRPTPTKHAETDKSLRLRYAALFVASFVVMGGIWTVTPQLRKIAFASQVDTQENVTSKKGPIEQAAFTKTAEPQILPGSAPGTGQTPALLSGATGSVQPLPPAKSADQSASSSKGTLDTTTSSELAPVHSQPSEASIRVLALVQEAQFRWPGGNRFRRM